ncbi:MAG TPA: enoyl-CoA hydratase/isomerase family protein [Terriglobales bacterium]|nr:enoyl-CoA hydratase/isomerase family protein [Terriglobales bacterium]
MADQNYSRLMVAMQAPVARVIFANPPVNVIDLKMMDELLSVLAEVEQRTDIVAVVFGGSDRAFSAGVDVAAHMPERVQEMLTKFHAVIRAVITSKKVTVAAVRGTCLGGGAELAAVCDMVFTTDSANWGFPEISLGCFPPAACALLGAVVGQKHAAELILTGRQVSGEEAMRIGLANEALPEDELADIVDDTCDRMGQLSPAALAITKKALYAWNAAHWDKGLDRAEKIYFDELMKTEDAVEGVRAFMEKRPARWTGR